MKYKVAFTDYDFESINIEKDILSSLQCEIIEIQSKDERVLKQSLADADAVIVQYAPISKKVISNMKSCKVIVRYGIGVDTIDLDSATSKGILVCNVPDYCIGEVADHTLALILSLNRKVTELNALVKKGVWNALEIVKPIHSLNLQTLGIVGFGKVARDLYHKVKPLFKNVVVYDPYIKKDIVNNFNLTLVNFNTILKTDIISIHCLLTKETYHLFGKDEFKQMKKNAYIVNNSRGAIIDTDSLYDTLKQGVIAGAALDVLEVEPPKKNYKLLELNNLIITPHIAYYSESSFFTLKRKVSLTVLKVLKGEVPNNVVNKELIR